VVLVGIDVQNPTEVSFVRESRDPSIYGGVRVSVDHVGVYCDYDKARLNMSSSTTSRLDRQKARLA